MKRSTQVCTIASGQVAWIDSGTPLSPSHTTMHASSTPRFLIWIEDPSVAVLREPLTVTGSVNPDASDRSGSSRLLVPDRQVRRTNRHLQSVRSPDHLRSVSTRERGIWESCRDEAAGMNASEIVEFGVTRSRWT